MNARQCTKFVFALCVLTAIPAAFAAGDHKGHARDAKGAVAHAHQAKPLYGGVVAVVKDMNYELVTSPSSLMLYISDHDQPIDTQKSSATLTMLSGTEKYDVKLSPAGKNTLKADGMFKVAPNTKVVAVVKIDGKAAQSVRFVLR